MSNEPSFYFDPDTHREVPHDRSDAHAWVEHLARQGHAGDPMRVEWLRILGRLGEAEELGWIVLERSGGPNTRAGASQPLPLSSATAAVRLAHVLQWREEFALAHTLYAGALTTIDRVPPLHEDTAYADYLRPCAYQHLARFYFDQGDYEAALTTAQQAWELQVAAGVPNDQTLLSSGFIDAVRSRLHSRVE